MKHSLVTLFFFCLILFSAALIGFYYFILSGTSRISYEESVRFDVAKGESYVSVEKRLYEKNLIKTPYSLRAGYRVQRFLGHKYSLKAGEYEINEAASKNVFRLLELFNSGRSRGIPFTVPEGYNIFEISALIDRFEFLSGQRFQELAFEKKLVNELLGSFYPEAVSFEGFLYPETYHLNKHMSEIDVIHLMTRNFFEAFDRVEHKSQETGLSNAELVILASIIEKETGAPEERTVISSVFHNRLQKNMRLQTDPTIIYGLWLRGLWDGRIRRRDLREQAPYNTYVIPRLPPGPIANPGFHALKAAADPSDTDFLFFVSRNDGTHVFSRTYAEHRKAVEHYQLDRRQREGRSWRDLQNRDTIPENIRDARDEF